MGRKTAEWPYEISITAEFSPDTRPISPYRNLEINQGAINAFQLFHHIDRWLPMNGAMIAGVQSGCGKTTATLSVMQFLRTAGQQISPFKTGPDFLDPMWHQAVTGQVSNNLCTQMMGNELCRETFDQSCQGDFALVEGVMGLFDGRSGVGGAGSSVDLAQALNIPIWLVVDAKGMSGSIVPLVRGFVSEAEKSGATIAGVIGNRLGSVHHAKLLQELLAEQNLPPLIAWLEKDAPQLPERHLGLTMPGETEVPNFLPFLHTKLEALLEHSSKCCTNKSDDLKSIEPLLLEGKRIAIARDAACCFIYPANLRWLTDQGATLHFFSPLKGEPVPKNCDAVWLPGGYPELHAYSLSNSKTWESLEQHIELNRPVLAECGGMMLLGCSLRDHAGNAFSMSNILPFDTRMQNRLAGLGFRQDDSGARGHEFHHSTRESHEELPAAFSPQRGDTGVSYRSTRASYIHWYFPASSEVCAKWFGV